jgi:hypothetical protein
MAMFKSIIFLILGAADLTLQSCARPDSVDADPKEAWDPYNRPALFGVTSARYEELASTDMSFGAAEQKPWQDDYWPYIRKNIANRYLEGTEFHSFDSQINNARNNPTNRLLSPAEKYDLLNGDSQFTLTRDSWQRFERYLSQFGFSKAVWGWMGICSGWAPASISEPAPLNHVLAVTELGQEILFFQGDIRGLLSKAYDVNRSSETGHFMGTRCNGGSESIPRNAGGRPIDGRFDDSYETFHIINDWSASKGILQITFDIERPQLLWLAARSPFRKLGEQVYVFVYDDRRKMVDDINSKKLGRNAASRTSRPIHMFKSCRDINPGAFHLALAQSLGNAVATKQSFVLEIDRGAQVWNHPVWGYKSEVGRPISVERDDPATRYFRAPGTTHIVQVKTQVMYIAEPPLAKMTYKDERGETINWENVHEGHHQVREFEYSLELDANGFVIGGEWSEKPENLAKTPDFMWRKRGQLTDLDKKGEPSVIKYSVVKRLLDCSMGTPDPDTTHEVWTPGGMQNISAVRCQL